MKVSVDGWVIEVKVLRYYPSIPACREHPEEGGGFDYEITKASFNNVYLPDALPSDKEIERAVYQAAINKQENEQE